MSVQGLSHEYSGPSKREKTMSKQSFEVDGKQMLQLLKERTGSLYRWDLGFFCLSPQPVGHAFGDFPKEPWIGTVMFQQLVSAGVLLPTGVLTRGDTPKEFRTKPENEFIQSQSQLVRSAHRP